jgi:hypothetical protein
MTSLRKPHGQGAGQKSGTIPFYRLYIDEGKGLKVWRHPVVGSRFSHAVAIEMATVMRQSPVIQRVVMTQIEE